MKMTKKIGSAFSGLLLLAAFGRAQSLRLKLDESVDLALQGSHSLQAAHLEAQAAEAHVSLARAALLPRLSLEGSYRWVSIVPEVKLSPLAPPAKFGDNNNYSLGLAATWDVFGGLASWRQMQTAQELAKAKGLEARSLEEALRLRVRLAYFFTQLAAAKVRLLADSLNLAQSQSADLELRLKAGTSSRIDALAASNEELDRRAEFRLAQADLAGALRDLLALSGQAPDADVSLPVEDAVGQSLPAKVSPPTLSVSMDGAAALLNSLAAAGERAFEPGAHPRQRALLAAVEAARRQADLAFAGHYPHGSVGARYSLDYPNGPVLEQVDQTTLSANISVPIYSFGAVSKQVDEQVDLANAANERAEAAATDLKRDWQKSHDRLAALRQQRDLEAQRQAQAATLQDLVYRAYKVGGANYLEVQSSSLRALQAGMELAVTETQILIELANLSALTEDAR